MNRRTDAYRPVRVCEGVFLVPGDPRLTRFHTELIVDGDDMLRPTRRSAFRRIALAAAAACGATLVLVDMSPSTGVLNKVVLMSCDACLPCTFCDDVSLSAACMFFTDTFGEWLAWQEAAVRKDRELFASGRLSAYIPRVRYPAKPPVLLPMIVSGFAVERVVPPPRSVRPESESKEEEEAVAVPPSSDEAVAQSAISLSDSQRIIKAVSLLASGRVPAAAVVQHMRTGTQRPALRPMVPGIATWLSREPFTLERAVSLAGCPDSKCVAARFDELLAELAALRRA